MYYAHYKNPYNTKDPIPLSENSLPIVELYTRETEYKGLPYTACIGSESEKSEKYDISSCKAMRKVQNIIKGMCIEISLNEVHSMISLKL